MYHTVSVQPIEERRTVIVPPAALCILHKTCTNYRNFSGMSQPVTIEPVTSGRATIKTTAGDVVIEFWPKESKLAVRNFVQLALEGYYDGCIFHRVVPGLCVQSGDASNSGHGGESIYDSEPFADEFSQRLRFNRRGLIACANAGTRNSNLSQYAHAIPLVRTS